MVLVEVTVVLVEAPVVLKLVEATVVLVEEEALAEVDVGEVSTGALVVLVVNGVNKK